MKFNFLIILFIITSSLSSQEMSEVPPGTIRLNDSLYIDKAPIDNIMYKEFAVSVLKLWSFTLSDSLQLLPLEDIDPSLLTKPLNPVQSIDIFNKVALDFGFEISNEVDSQFYFEYPDYQFNPVLNISQEQALLYCKWRTDMVNLLWSTKVQNKRKIYKKVNYRLPTEEEYRLAKKTFLKKEKLFLINEDDPLKMDMKKLRDKDMLFFYDLSELTLSGKKFLEASLKAGSDNSSERSFNLFRCVCEIQQ